MSKQGEREKLAINSNERFNETMDVTGSLRKIASELVALRREDPDLELRLEGASWLITYIADALDVELQHAVMRGMKQITSGGKDYNIISGEEL